MSQSDYISYKKMHREMEEYSKTPKKIPSILEAGKYISYKEYALVNTIIAHKEQYDKLVDPDIPIVFDIVKPCANNTPVIPFCVGTNTRTNRKPIDLITMYPFFRKPPLNSIPKPTRMRWKPMQYTKMCLHSCDDSYGKW